MVLLLPNIDVLMVFTLSTAKKQDDFKDTKLHKLYYEYMIWNYYLMTKL